MKKLVYVLPLLIFLTGCSKVNNNYDTDTINYNLTIGKYYKENINVVFSSNAEDIANEEIDSDIQPLEYIMYYEMPKPIFSNQDILYNKTLKKLKDKIIFSLDYNYIEEDFTNSNFIMTCFENYNITNSDTSYDIELSGKFYCLYDKTLIIKVNSYFDVLESNGNKDNNTYTWIIDSSNKDNVNIKYKLKRHSYSMIKDYNEINSNKNRFTNFIIIGLIIVLFVIIFMVYKKVKGKYE